MEEEMSKWEKQLRFRTFYLSRSEINVMKQIVKKYWIELSDKFPDSKDHSIDNIEIGRLFTKLGSIYDYGIINEIIYDREDKVLQSNDYKTNTQENV